MRPLPLALALLVPIAGCGGDDGDAPPGGAFSFFVTSTGGPNGGDLRRGAADTDGLAGADELCRSLAAAAAPDAAGRAWRAYLSTATVNARDRIGAGPWFNRNGARVASSLENLHDAEKNMITLATALDERGARVPGRNDTPIQHDILTGSTADGLATADHCAGWTSSAASGTTAQVGHHDRQGGGAAPQSWNAAHATQGCSAAAFVALGGRGSFYCFAAD